MKTSTGFLGWAIAAAAGAAAVTIAEINGNRYLSPYAGRQVTNVTGVVLARGPAGIWIRSTTPDDNPATSEAIYVFGNASSARNLSVGTVVSLDGKVTEYRSSPAYIPLTEITSPKNVRKVSTAAANVSALVIGKHTPPPPTARFSSLDGGAEGDDMYALPNAARNVSVVNPVLKPREFGLDFWESLSGELVTVRRPRAVARPNRYGDTWVVGDWAVTGANERGGVTMTARVEPANPLP